MNKKRISFSGGQSSGKLLRDEMEKNPKTFLQEYSVDFCNTGREYNETLDFVHAVEKSWGIPITWLEYCLNEGKHSFKVVDYKTASRRDSIRGPFDQMLEIAGALPSVMGRSCSGQLKVRTMRRYLQSIGLTEWESFIGIRNDERHRTLEVMSACPKYITPRFPLCDSNQTIKDVNDFWDNHPFKLNIPNHKGNCDLCFLKARWKRLAILRTDPNAATWWINWEKKFIAKGVTGNGAKWQENKSYEGLLIESQHPEFDFNYIDPNDNDVSCSCVVSGYRDSDI